MTNPIDTALDRIIVLRDQPRSEVGTLRRGLRRALSRFALWLFRTRVVYRGDTLAQLRAGGTLFTCNHVSFLDAVLIAFASPSRLVYTSEPLYSRQTLWSRSIFAVLYCFGYGWIIPLDQRSPMGMRQVARALKAGHNVVIFPEGRISPDGRRGPPLPGVQWLVERGCARVVELELTGAHHSRLFAKSGRHWWPPIKLTF